MSNLNKTDPQMSKFNLPNLTNTVFFEKSSFSNKINILILDAAVDYILSTKRFGKPLIKYVLINPFSTNVSLCCNVAFSTNANLRFSDVFRGYRSGTLVDNG